MRLRTRLLSCLPPCLLLLAGSAAAQDMLVVAPKELQPALETWTSHRVSQGHSIVVEEPEKELAELVRSAYERSSGRLRYVLLLGDVKAIGCAHFDGQIIKPYERDPRIANDHHLADLDGDHLPELAVGRIPADTLDEARTMLRKIVEYEKRADFGPWRRRMNVIGGIGGFGKLQDFALERVTARFLTDNVPPACDLQVTYANPSSPFCPPPRLLQQTVLGRFNEGALAVAYLGHGSRLRLDRMFFDRFSYDIFTEDDTMRLEARHGPPIAFLLCCNAGQFDGAPDCLAELMLKQPGGPVAILAASRVSMPYGNGVLGKEVLSALYEQRIATLGEIVRQAKRLAYPDRPEDKSRQFMEALAMAYQWRPDLRARERLEHLYLYNLLGDPAMRIPLPEPLRIECTLALPRLTVSVEAPVAGKLMVEVVPRRDMPRGERKGKTDEAFAKTYAAANRFAFRRQTADGTKGANTFEFELPPNLAIGFYHVRAYLQAAKDSHMGSADFRVRLEKKG